MSEHQMIAAMLGLLGILTLFGLVILSRDLRAISRMTEENLKLSREIRQRMN